MINSKEALQQWYVLRGEEKYGPFEYQAMIRMMQQHELYDYNYIWAPHMESWTLLGETPEFSKDRLARVFEKDPTAREAFQQRQAPRAALEIPVYGHDQNQFFDGKTLSLSENGALVLLNTPLLQPGQELVLHLKNKDHSLGGMNVIAQIVRKNFTRTRLNVKSGLLYAVKFVQISNLNKEKIKQLISSDLKEAVS